MFQVCLASRCYLSDFVLFQLFSRYFPYDFELLLFLELYNSFLNMAILRLLVSFATLANGLPDLVESTDNILYNLQL